VCGLEVNWFARVDKRKRISHGHHVPIIPPHKYICIVTRFVSRVRVYLYCKMSIKALLTTIAAGV